MLVYATTIRSPRDRKITLAYVVANDAEEACRKLERLFGGKAKVQCGGASLNYILSCGFTQVGKSDVYV